MSIKELGPRYNTPEKQTAELARRQHISDRLSSLSPAAVVQRRERMSSWQKGASKPEQTVKGWSHTWTAIYPLILRDALVRDMMEMTGFSYGRIRSAIYNKARKVNKVDDYTDPEKERERRSRSHKGRRLGVLLNLREQERESGNIAFAKLLEERGVFTDDVIYWEEMHQLYKENDRELPGSFFAKLRLEAFLKARQEIFQGNGSPFAQYIKIGIQVGGSYRELTQEEEFIKNALAAGEQRASRVG